MQRKNRDSLGEVIKSARQSLGITQMKLAERLHISERYLKAIENSGRKPSYDLFVRIVKMLEIHAYAIARFENEESTDKIYIFHDHTKCE